jgi:hypothetical protein
MHRKGPLETPWTCIASMIIWDLPSITSRLSRPIGPVTAILPFLTTKMDNALVYCFGCWPRISSRRMPLRSHMPLKMPPRL